MKLLALQTPEELGLLNNIMYKGIAFRFNSLFARNEYVPKTVIAIPAAKEDSQFYKKLVELAWKGDRAKATVLHINETGLLVNNDPVISLTLRFQDKKKVMQEVTAKTIVPRISIPKIADNIMIAYKDKEPDIVAVL